MKRIFPDHTYGPGPRSGCWWDDTCVIPPAPDLTNDLQADVIVIGAGFTGLSAALHLAEADASVVVLEAKTVGWGASGRNGGFCCLGGGMLEDAALDKRLGREERLRYRAAEVRAVDHVRGFLARQSLDVDMHSQGETVLANRAKDMAVLKGRCRAIRENYGEDASLLTSDDLRARGLEAGFFGGLTVPIGFGLNPRKYLEGLRAAAVNAGVRIFENTPVQRLHRIGGAWEATSARASARAPKAVIATNGYSSEDLSGAIARRFMPTQSSVLVTRPLSESERAAQGWTSPQMCYDTRNLLHYFRLMPDGRFLFGMRGGLLGGAGAERRARHRLLRHFHRMFPAWKHVEISHVWSGLVALSRTRLPFAGPCRGYPGLFASLCYHGNGVAMGSYCGKLVAQDVQGETPATPIAALRQPMRTFPLGAMRRLLMPPIYAGLMLRDL